MRSIFLILVCSLLFMGGAAAQVDVIVDPIRDVLPGEAIYYPVLVYNNEDVATQVTIGLQGTQDWAVYRVDPSRTFMLEPEQGKEIFIYLKTDEDAPAGVKDFHITATHDGQSDTAPLRLAVLREREDDVAAGAAAAVIGAIVIIALLIVLAFLITSQPKKRSTSKKSSKKSSSKKSKKSKKSSKKKTTRKKSRKKGGKKK